MKQTNPVMDNSNLNSLVSSFNHRIYLIFANNIEIEKDLNTFFFELDRIIKLEDIPSIKDFLNSVSDKELRKVVIKSKGISYSAQNALLKPIEDIDTKTCLFFIFPSGIKILPTFLSRAMVINETSFVDTKEVDSFFKLSLQKRLKFLSNLIDEPNSSKEVAAHLFLDKCEIYIHKNFMNMNIYKFIELVFNLRKIINEGAFSRNIFNLLAFVDF